MADAALKPVYLLTGSDRPKIETALSRLRAHFDDSSVDRLSAVEASGADVVAACNAGSLFGGRRLVVVQDVDGRANAEGLLRGGWKAADVDAIVRYLIDPAPDTVLAVVATGLKKDASLAKAVAKTGDVLTYEVVKRRLQAWVAERFKQHGVRAEPDACATLVQLVGEDLHALATEIDKLVTWAADEPIGEAEVVQLVAASADRPVYMISDAWGRRDAGMTLAAVEEYQERAGRPAAATVAIAANQLARHVGAVRRAKILDDEGVSPRDAQKQLGVRYEFQAQRAYEHARNFSEEELDAALVRLAHLDHSLKGGSRLAPELELTLAIVASVSQERPHRRGE
jgi:DNA polymerase III subunit delta